MLDEDLELRHFTHRVILLVVHFLPLMVNTFIHIELNCVVSSSDSLDIEVNEFILLNLLDVVHIDYCEQIDKHANTSDQKTESLSLIHVWEFTLLSLCWWWKLSLSNNTRSL